MPGVLLILSVLGAQPSGAVKIAAPHLDGINLDPRLTAFYMQHLAQQLGYAGVQVTTPDEVGAVLGLERQRQLLGCGDDSACALELANALGVDGLLMGSVAKVVDTFQVNLKVVSAVDSRVLAAWSVRTDDEEALLQQLTAGARALAAELYARLGRGPAPEPVKVEVAVSSGRLRRAWWAPGLVGLVLLASGVTTFVLAEGESRKLRPGPGVPPTPLVDAQRAVAQGETYQTLTWVALSASAACLLTAAAFYVFGAPGAQARPTAWVSPHGAGIVFGGALP